MTPQEREATLTRVHLECVQGGGVSIAGSFTQVNFSSCNIYDNTATDSVSASVLNLWDGRTFTIAA
jgi:hypothetical protein